MTNTDYIHDNDEDGDAAPTPTPYWRSSKFVEVLLCFALVPIGIGSEFVEAYERPIPRIQTEDGQYLAVGVFDFDDEGETISSSLMFILGIASPFILQIILGCWKKDLARTDIIHKTCCVFFMGLGCTQILTSMVKLYAGYLRPIFYALCVPDENYEQCISEDYGQGRKSFPSGHSSNGTCGLLLFSFFLEDTFGLSSYLRRRINATPEQRKLMPEDGSPWVRLGSVFCYTPMLLALFIGESI
mmetsp:Transcript_18494/g.42523  ORF Transcript_18494/g.42523 Transcript_18494/m.42523 type:complete len:243 (+) Transcript_18494:170-898(+)